MCAPSATNVALRTVTTCQAHFSTSSSTKCHRIVKHKERSLLPTFVERLRSVSAGCRSAKSAFAIDPPRFPGPASSPHPRQTSAPAPSAAQAATPPAAPPHRTRSGDPAPQPATAQQPGGGCKTIVGSGANFRFTSYRFVRFVLSCTNRPELSEKNRSSVGILTLLARNSPGITNAEPHGGAPLRGSTFGGGGARHDWRAVSIESF